MKRPDWLVELHDELLQACKAFTNETFPDAWLYLGRNPGHRDNDWYDREELLFGKPVFHATPWLKHCSAADGEPQHIIPLWFGDVSDKDRIIREFECRLGKTGDF
jgi:hypothetical protein